jgi:hypothetical protein
MWLNFGGPCVWRCCFILRSILWSFGVFCGKLVNFFPFGYFVPRKIWQKSGKKCGKVYFSCLTNNLSNAVIFVPKILFILSGRPHLSTIRWKSWDIVLFRLCLMFYEPASGDVEWMVKVLSEFWHDWSATNLRTPIFLQIWSRSVLRPGGQWFATLQGLKVFAFLPNYYVVYYLKDIYLYMIHIYI